MKLLLAILLTPFAIAYIIVTAVLLAPFMVFGEVYEFAFGEAGPRKTVEKVVDRVWFV